MPQIDQSLFVNERAGKYKRHELIPLFMKAETLALDTETCDLEQKDFGPGHFRSDCYMLGASLDTGNFSCYLNMDPNTTSTNEIRKNKIFLSQVLKPDKPKIGANIAYDYGWLKANGIECNGPLIDVQYAEALLDEYRHEYNLDSLSREYLGEGKEDNEVIAFLQAVGIPFKKDFREKLYMCPPEIIQKYAIKDAANASEIWKIQRELLAKEKLNDIFLLESDLIRPMQIFRENGVKIDTELRDVYAQDLLLQLHNIRKEFEEYGIENPNSHQQVIEAINIHDGIPPKYSPKGNVVANAKHLQTLTEKSKIAANILEYRSMAKINNDFLLGAFLKFVDYQDIVHCSFHPLKQDKNGTVSGRFSSSLPNMQNIPSKELEWDFADACRKVCIPFEDCFWAKADFSQIEYRFIAHYAMGRGAEAVRAAYRENKDVDFHQMIMDLTGLARRLSKNLNFGVAFGMGINSMSTYFGWDADYCRDIYTIYNHKAPFMKYTLNEIGNVAKKRFAEGDCGYIRTILGRKGRLHDKRKAYIMLNKLVQGSAADLMKKAIIECYTAGIFDVIYPHLTVHDEIDSSVPKTKEGFEALREMNHIMETCIEISVPIMSEISTGANWNDVTEENYEELCKQYGKAA